VGIIPTSVILSAATGGSGVEGPVFPRNLKLTVGCPILSPPLGKGGTKIPSPVSAASLARQSSKKPWFIRQNYILDMLTMKLGKVDDGVLQFAPSPATTHASS